MIFAILLAAFASAAAQTIEITDLYQPAPVAGSWKYHHGDDPHYRDPAFDDSSWQDLQLPGTGHDVESGVTWYRVHIRLPEQLPPRPLGILVGSIAQAYDLYVNGANVGTFGNPRAGLRGLLVPTPARFSFPVRSGSVALAIRAWHELKPVGFWVPRFSEGTFIATEPLLDLKQAEYGLRRQQRSMGLALSLAATMVAASFFLLVPLWRRDSTEYLWCGLLLLLAVVLRILQLMPWVLGTPSLASLTIVNLLVNPAFVLCWIRLFESLFGSRLSRPIQMLAALNIAFLTFGWIQEGGGKVLAIGVTGFVFLLTAIYIDLLRRASQRIGMWSIHLAAGLYMGANLIVFGQHALRSFGVPSPPLELPLFGTLIEPRAAASLLFSFAMAILLNQRSGRLIAEKQHLQQELIAAAEVQSLLLPSASTATPGYKVESVYLPAAEVGGDFHYTMPDGEDAFVVVIGDVSGKGLKAAMLVTMIVGALRNTGERRPAHLLRELNRSLFGQTSGAFVTCCCARFDQSGTVRFACAGHLSPYCDGEERAAQSALPFGLSPSSDYEELEMKGSSFTFLSDGVVEAANASGELFGFGRSREISGKAATEIANTARAWGQNDDITVVTVRKQL